MLHSPNLHHVAETGPWTPEPMPQPKEEMEPHVPHPYAVLLLKGCQTRFFRDLAAFRAATDDLGRTPRIVLVYSYEDHRYYPEAVVNGSRPNTVAQVSDAAQST